MSVEASLRRTCKKHFACIALERLTLKVSVPVHAYGKHPFGAKRAGIFFCVLFVRRRLVRVGSCGAMAGWGVVVGHWSPICLSVLEDETEVM